MHSKLWWQNESGLADWVRLQHTQRCPTPVLPLREGTRSLHIKLFLRKNSSDAVLLLGLLKPTDHMGQDIKDNL